MRGPNGQSRPADTVACAIAVARIATGEDTEILPSGRRRSGFAGSKSRSDSLTTVQRSEIAKKAADARWQQKISM
jgi:hypothetical protein